jgi:hypothetical protein
MDLEDCKASEMIRSADQGPTEGLSLRHIPWVVTRPAALFERVEDTGAYGPALIVLLGLVVLIGYAQVQTGLIDRVADRQTEARLAELEKAQYGLVDKLELKDAMDNVRKSGEFMKVFQRIAAIVITPAGLVASFLVISSVLYAAVALTGRKPEWHTLMSICVYAGFIELLACALRLLMMIAYRTTQVDTSLRMMSEPGKPSPWAAIDPFRIWFWVLVVMGVTVTRQLSRRAALMTCSMMFLIATAAIAGLEYLPVLMR